MATNRGVAAGKIYRLVDNGATLVPDTSGNWAGREPVHGLRLHDRDAPGGSTRRTSTGAARRAVAQRVWTLGQSLARPRPFGIAVRADHADDHQRGACAVDDRRDATCCWAWHGEHPRSSTYEQALLRRTTVPGAASVFGRIATATIARVFAGDDGGTCGRSTPTTSRRTNKVWSYTVPGRRSDQELDVLDFSERGADVRDGAGQGRGPEQHDGTALTGYPFTPGTATDSIRRRRCSTRAGSWPLGRRPGSCSSSTATTGSAGAAWSGSTTSGRRESVSGIGYDASPIATW